jgi:hypothetical protein
LFPGKNKTNEKNTRPTENMPDGLEYAGYNQNFSLNEKYLTRPRKT